MELGHSLRLIADNWSPSFRLCLHIYLTEEINDPENEMNALQCHNQLNKCAWSFECDLYSAPVCWQNSREQFVLRVEILPLLTHFSKTILPYHNEHNTHRIYSCVDIFKPPLQMFWTHFSSCLNVGHCKDSLFILFIMCHVLRLDL